MEGDSKQSKGGKARAAKLTPEERSEISVRAAEERWGTSVPKATHDGILRIGEEEIIAAVLPNKTRVLTQATFLRALGRSRSPKGGTGVLNTVDGTPFFLQAEILKPFISEDLLMSTAPIFYRDCSGKRAVGYDARTLPQVANVYLELRDAYLAAGKAIPSQYEHIIVACDLLNRALAVTGIVALVDEATGYQEVRDRDALQALLDLYLSKEFAAWAKRFPDEFYRQIFRLRNWEWKGMKVNRPQVVGKYTNDIVYARLLPELLADLEQRNPKDDAGRRRVRHQQWLSEDVGHPALAQHLHAVIALMRASETWKEFQTVLNRAFPIKTRVDDLPLFDDGASRLLPGTARLPDDETELH